MAQIVEAQAVAPTTEGLVVVTLAAQVKVVHKVVGLAEGQVTTKVVAHFQADQVMEMGEMVYILDWI